MPEEEGRHLTRVLRLRIGAWVVVFDGAGRQFLARVESVGAGPVVVRLAARTQPAPESRIAVTLGQAILKRDQMSAVIRDAVMLGVARVQPLITSRTVVPSPVARRRDRVEHWRRVAVASTKQCGRAVVPEVAEPVSLQAFVESCRATHRFLLVEPDAPGAAGGDGRTRGLGDAPASAVLAVGPEGGWTAREVEAAMRGEFERLTLGGRTLRADAAACVALAALQVRWGEL